MANCAYRYSGHKCPHPRYRDSEHCVFHHQAPEEKCADFQTALEVLIKKAEADGADSIDMRGFVFPEFELSNRTFSATGTVPARLAFQASHFHGGVVFRNSIHEGEVDFSECVFHQPIEFQNCTFQHDVAFRKCEIRATCDFSSTKFYTEASFSSTTFKGAANFRFAEFKEKASFRKSEFAGTANFKETESDKEIDFKECQFMKSADFFGAKFEKLVSFRQSIFYEECTLKQVVFDGEVSAESSKFKDNLLAEKSRFNGKADFSKSTFRKKIDFPDSRFFAEARFSDSYFHRDLVLDRGRFEGRALFQDCVFTGNLFARYCEFSEPTEFQGAQFHNELDFTGTKFAFMKNSMEKTESNAGVRFYRAILEDSHFWGTDIIDGYSFEDAFLLSLNLSNKQIKNCNFTGAVVSGVNTRNWSLDETTKQNTKYVYSDYKVERVIENNEEKTIYKPDEDSIVPAEGHFGEGEHENYTIQEYLKSLCVWSLSLRVPPTLRKAFLDYIHFFSEYVRATEMVDVEIRTRREGKKLRVEFVTETEDEKKLVQDVFPRFLSTARPGLGSDLEFLIRDPDMTQQERDGLIKDHDAEIANFRQRLTSKSELLENEKEKNALLLEFIKRLESHPTGATNLMVVKDEETICAIHMDIAGYSKATADQPALSPAIQSKLNEVMEQLKQDRDVQQVRGTGDGLLIIVSNSETAAWIAGEVRSEIRKFNRRKGNFIKGVRTIIGYGMAFKEQHGESVAYTGQVLTQVNRLDQPMKRFMNENPSEGDFPIWCSEAYFSEMEGKSPEVRFERIGPVELDKEAGTQTVYRVVLP
uniref:Uncharacterized protein YjbI, contains pentapeptide repeats n=1 Tax=Candidatus Kentrum sp. LPFa TaxID=2126335 RepID=A0A450W5I6_9GAMM|nr:MAG: Uncharacterized protein YjbI, contains pentapeptide repeats [Candidatus Kentron sp. LPFa]